MDLDSLIERVESTHKKYLEARESFRVQKELDDKTIKQLTDQVNQLQEELALAKNNLESSILKQEEADKQSSVKSNRLNDEVDRLRKEVEELQKNAERFEEYKKSLQTELTDAHTETSSVKNKLIALEVSKKDVETAFSELKEKHNKMVLENSSVEELNNTIKTLTTSKEELENKVAELTKVVSEQELKIGELNSNLSKKDDAITSLRSTLPIKKTTNSNLEEFINSTIPVPEDSAAINVRQVKRGSDISIGTVPYRFGRTSPKIMEQVIKLIDALYKNTYRNREGNFQLNSAMQAIDASGIDTNTYNVTMNRLKAMNFNGKPLIIQSGNIYYGTLDSESLKNYLMES